MKIRPKTKGDCKGILKVAEKLRIINERTGWFTEDAIKKLIPIDIKLQKGFVAEENDSIIGFVTYTSKNGEPFIGWIGVDPQFHRKGIGKRLIEKVCEELKKIGAKELYVETPSREEGLGNPYEGTYKFYEAVGFKLVKVFPKEERKENCEMALLKRIL